MDSNSFLRLVGGRIRTLREARSWSQEDLARRADRHFTYIGRIERGEQNLTLEVLLAVAGALDTTPEALVVKEPHQLLIDWGIAPSDVIEAIGHGFRAQIDVKGKLAELFLYRELVDLNESGALTGLEWCDEDGKPDFVLRVKRRTYVVECKNVRSLSATQRSASPIKVEIQKTRNSKDGTPTRGYTTDHFHVLSACLFNRTRQWRFLHIATRHLASRPEDPSRLKVFHTVPEKAEDFWRADILEALSDVKGGNRE